jgi:uncharacterized 2Fe-2S/4Fe-4S cluster protein (DUF4445 family)
MRNYNNEYDQYNGHCKINFRLFDYHLQIIKLYYADYMHRIRFEPSGRQAEITPGESLLTAADRAGVLIVAPCGGRGVCRKCCVKIGDQEVLACTHIPLGDEVVKVPPVSLSSEPSEQKALDYVQKVLPLPGSKKDRILAIDLGTTGIAVAWIDTASGEVRYGKARNRQVLYGADVLSRIMMIEDMGAEGSAIMRRLARQSVTEAIMQLGSVQPANQVVVSTNPTMLYLLLGWDPSPLRSTSASALKLKPSPLVAKDVLGEVAAVLPEAEVKFLPGVANYLGGDVMAGVALAQKFYPKDGNFLLIDAGTNGEIILAVEDAILGIATSAGPAFEGGEVAAGTPAMPGAIEQVRIEAATFWSEYGTIAELPPIGICGSGIIELVAELNKVGALDRNGYIKKEMLNEAFATEAGARTYIVVPAAATANGRVISVSDADLGAIINTKAAIFAGCRKLTKTMDINFEDLQHIFICGDFGYHINIGDAINIGMLPDVDPAKYCFLGNASLAGAAISGLLPEFAQLVAELAAKTAFLDLGEDQVFMDEFIAACFLPHTDLRLFPSLLK